MEERSAVRDEPDLREREAELRRVGDEGDVGGDREAEAGTERVPVDGCDDGLLELRQGQVDRGEERAHAPPRLERLALAVHLRDVASGAERTPRAGDQHDAYRGVGSRLDDRVGELRLELQVEGVEAVRSVQR